MTASQRLYETNAATCRVIGHFLEVLIDKYNTHMTLEEYGQAIETARDIEVVSIELDELYDIQVNLFFVVKEEKRQAAQKLLIRC